MVTVHLISNDFLTEGTSEEGTAEAPFSDGSRASQCDMCRWGLEQLEQASAGRAPRKGCSPVDANWAPAECDLSAGQALSARTACPGRRCGDQF